jgi:branched-chain amino acid transport system substrate-binding protein
MIHLAFLGLILWFILLKTLAAVRRVLQTGLATSLLFGAALGNAQDLVVGQLASVTNPVTKVIAAEYNGGIALAFKRANLAGGVQGRKLRLELADDRFDATLTLALAQQLVDQRGVVAFVGGMGTQTTMKLISERFMERYRVAYFAPLSGLTEALSAPNVFPVRASFGEEVKAMFSHAASLGRQNVAFVYFKAGAGPSLSKLVPDWANTAKVNLTANEGFAMDPDAEKQLTNIQSALKQLGTMRPDAVVLIAVGPAHAMAVKALRERFGTWMPVYSLGQVNVEELVAKAGKEGARGVSLTQVMPSPGSVDMRIVREFNADRLKHASELPTTYMTLEGYIAGRVLVEVMQRARTLTREGVLDAALNVGDLSVSDFRVQYRAQQRRSLNPVDVTLIDRDGRLMR